MDTPSAIVHAWMLKTTGAEVIVPIFGQREVEELLAA